MVAYIHTHVVTLSLPCPAAKATSGEPENIKKRPKAEDITLEPPMQLKSHPTAQTSRFIF